MKIRNFYACSVGNPKDDDSYDEENFKRIIAKNAFCLHENTIQKGFYSEIKPNDILILKYRNHFVAYGVSKGNLEDKDAIDGWKLTSPVEKWHFLDDEDKAAGVTTYGIQTATLGGSGQMATVKKLDIDFALDIIKKIKETPLYDNLLKERIMEINMKEIEKMINILKYKKQIILQGPPGTGKTRLAKEIAKQMIEVGDVTDLKNNDKFKLIQFHPSYTYEDFVRGIVSETKGDAIDYKVVNKTLGQFAEKAADAFLKKESKSEDEVIESLKKWLWNQVGEKSKFYIKETNIEYYIFRDESELKFYSESYNDSGTGFILHWETVKQKFPKNISSEKNRHLVNNTFKPIEKGTDVPYNMGDFYNSLYFYLAKNYNTIIVSESAKYVLVIDEINRANVSSVLGELIYALEYRGEAVESMYKVNENNKLILPPNLYIIGTMNTADRSVGHIDYAIRRRFAFVDVLPEKLTENDEIYFNTSGFEAVEKLFTNDIVCPEFEIKDVQVGHSYFIVKKSDTNDTEQRDAMFQMKMRYEIKPILREYLRDGILSANKKIGEDSIRDYIEKL